MVCTLSTNFLKADFIYSSSFFLVVNSQEHVMMARVRYNFLTINGYSKSKLPIPAPAKLEQLQANNWVFLDFLNKSWDILTNVEAPSISGFLACLEQPEQLIVIVILQWTVVGNKSLFLTIEVNPDDIKSKDLMKKCFSSQTSTLSHNMTQILWAWYMLTDRLGGKEVWRPPHFS